jgi:hypothetical protein
MLKTIDSMLVVLLWAWLIVLSVLTVIRMVRGLPGSGYYSLPESWWRWIHDEKPPVTDRKTNLSDQ